MIHKNPFISAFIGIPEWSSKNWLRHWLAKSPLVPSFIQDYSPIKGYEKFRKLGVGDIVIDVGAFPGDYALFAAKKVGQTGHVYALEPDPENRRILERNIRKSKLSNLTVIPKGLWKEQTALYMNSEGLASHIQDGGYQAIEVISLDELTEELSLDKLDVLKMDIEGAELQALAGARKTLTRFSPYTCIASYHIVDGKTTADRVETVLKEAGLHTCTAYPKHLTTFGSRESLL